MRRLIEFPGWKQSDQTAQISDQRTEPPFRSRAQALGWPSECPLEGRAFDLALESTDRESCYLPSDAELSFTKENLAEPGNCVQRDPRAAVVGLQREIAGADQAPVLHSVATSGCASGGAMNNARKRRQSAGSKSFWVRCGCVDIFHPRG